MLRRVSSAAAGVAASAALLVGASAAQSADTCPAGQQLYGSSISVSTCAAPPVASFQVAAAARTKRISHFVIVPTVKGQSVTVRCTDSCSRRTLQATAAAATKKHTTDIAVAHVGFKTGSTVQVTLSQPGRTPRRLEYEVVRGLPFLRRTGESCLPSAALAFSCAPFVPPAPAAVPAPVSQPAAAAPKPASAPAATDPIGVVSAVTRVSTSTAVVTGWAIDGDDPAAYLTVTALAEGVVAGATTASLPRADAGAGHGFSFVVTVGPGTPTVCVRATNVGGGGEVEIGNCLKPTQIDDLNGDGTVDCADRDLLIGNFRNANVTYASGDLNGDSVVNIFDLSVWLSNAPSDLHCG